MIKNVVDINVKCLLFLSVLMKQIFSTYFRKKNQISNFTTIHPVVAELFHADRLKVGQTLDEVNSRY